VEVAMKITQWKRKSNWDLQQKTITIWEAVCWRCGAVANHGYTEDEAIAVAQEEGWVDGLCFECWEKQNRRRGEQWGIP
jgi:hypothetical protein